MAHATLADELAALRQQIARLEARAAQIEARIARTGEGMVDGAQVRAVLVTQRHRVFDPDLLPDTLRADPRFWREEVTRQIDLVPSGPRPALRPGWPILRSAAALGLH